MKKLSTLVPLIVLSLIVTFGGLTEHPSSHKPSSPVANNKSTSSSSSVPVSSIDVSRPLKVKSTNGSRPQPQVVGTVISTPDQTAAKAYIANHGLTLIQNTTIDGGHGLLTISEQPSDPKVQGIVAALPASKTSVNYAYHAVLTPNDPLYPSQWALAKISAPSAWNISTGSSNTTIAVIDTGILFTQTTPSATYSQIDFPIDRMWTNPGESGGGKETNSIDDDGNGKIDDWRGWDFMGGWAGGINCPNGSGGDYILEDNDPQPYSCDNPLNPSQLNKNHYSSSCSYGFTGSGGACYIGHGTMVASVAAASTNNGQLIAGLNHNTKLMNLRVLDGYGETDTSLVTAAVRYASSKKVDVINLSIAINSCSYGFSDPILESALSDAKAAGITVVAAAGNEGASSSGSVCYPGSSPSVIGVGATDINDNLANFSNFGPQLDVTAPGVNVYVDNAPSSYLPNDSYSGGSGTSFSTPYVAGLAALLKTTAPTATPDQIYNFITGQADKVSGMQGANRTDHYGYGRINSYRSLKTSVLAHPDGTLIIKPEGTVYLVENSQLRHVLNPPSFVSNYGGEIDSRVKPEIIGDLQLSPGSNVDYAEGTLLKGSGPAIYAVEINDGSLKKRHIVSPAVYQNLGYDSSSFINVPDSLLPAATGADIVEGSRHPNGTLIQEPGALAIYLLENGRKRYVPSPAILHSLHKNDFRFYLGVTADMQLPNGTNVDFAEGALIRDISSHKIYVVDTNGGIVTKRHITSLDVYQMLGFTAEDVINVSASQLPSTDGLVID